MANASVFETARHPHCTTTSDPARARVNLDAVDWNESAGLRLSSRFVAQGVPFEHARSGNGIARDGGCTSHPGGIYRTWPTRRDAHCRAPAHRARQERRCACPRPNETMQSSAADRLNGDLPYRRTLTAQPREFSARLGLERRPAVDAAASAPPRCRVCPDRNSFLVPRMERDFGLHTTTERRSLKTPGLRVRFQFQSILSPAGRWSYSRRPLFIVERAFSALQFLDLHLAEFDHAGAVLERERSA